MATTVDSAMMTRAWFLGALASAVALVLPFVVDDPSWRKGLLVGAACGVLSGAVGFVLIGRALVLGTKQLIAALAISFLLRILLVGVGLVATIVAAKGQALGFVASFFGLFAAFAGLELLVANDRVRVLKADQKAA